MGERQELLERDGRETGMVGERWGRGGREVGERWGRGGREVGERWGRQTGGVGGGGAESGSTGGAGPGLGTNQTVALCDGSAAEVKAAEIKRFQKPGRLQVRD